MNTNQASFANDMISELALPTLSPERATRIGEQFLSMVTGKVDLNSFTPFEALAPELVLEGYEALVEQSLLDRRKASLDALTEKLSPYAARALTVCDAQGLAL